MDIITLAISNQKMRHRYFMSTTSILKIIRNFRLIEIIYSTDETFHQMCNTIFDDIIHRYFSFWKCFFNIWNTWIKSNTKKTWTKCFIRSCLFTKYVGRDYVNRDYVNLDYMNRLCKSCWMKWIENKRNNFIESSKMKVEKTVVRSKSTNR